MLSSNPGALILLVVFALGATLFAVGTALVRRAPGPHARLQSGESMPALAPWTAELAGTNDVVERDIRVDMIERLAMIGEPWCVTLLERARTQDADASVRDSAESALLVIGARPRG